MTRPPKEKASISWGQRPSSRVQTPVAGTSTADAFVKGAKSDILKFNFNMSRALHARMKVQCAIQGRNMTDVIIELLEAHFPAPKGE
jgi:hypothetical protein